MKPILLSLSALALIALGTSCTKSIVPDEPDTDSKIEINDIAFTNLYKADNVYGVFTRKFHFDTQSGDSTFTVRDSFTVTNVNSYTQKLYFNQPKNSNFCEVDLKIYTVNPEPANPNNPIIGSLKYVKNKKDLLSLSNLQLTPIDSTEIKVNPTTGDTTRIQHYYYYSEQQLVSFQ